MKLYPETSPLEVEPHFSRHMEAMTAERLHDKGDIALQLALRDKRIAELEAALHRDQTGLAQALDAVRKRASGGQWIADGRGNYEWDDDRYRAETGHLIADVLKIVHDALVTSGNLAQVMLVKAGGR